MTARLNLLFGFLGSGKTTLARRFLDRRKTGGKMAVIVNEFGDVGIDGAILEGRDINMIELTSGCLCCTLKGSLLNAVEELVGKAGADQIVIEATGVAQPDELIETFADPSTRARYDIGPIVTVVDSAKYLKLKEMLGEFYQAQVQHADAIILNKIDLVSAAVIENIESEVRRLNPRAEVQFAERCDVDVSRLLDGPSSGIVRAFAHSHRDHDASEGTHGHDNGHGHALGNDHRHAPAESFVVDSSSPAARHAVETFFQELPETVWRAKGFMTIDGCFSLVQYAMGEVEITATSPRPASNMVFIGQGLDTHGITQRFRSMLGAVVSNPLRSPIQSGKGPR